MKKKITAIVLLIAIMISGAYASDTKVDIDMNGYAGMTGLTLNFGTEGFTGSISVNPGVDIYINGDHGVDLRLPIMFNQDGFLIGVQAGYGGKFHIRNNVDIGVRAGLNNMNLIADGVNLSTLGLYTYVDARYYVDSLYFTVGAGFDTTLGVFTEGMSDGMFQIELALPTLGIGYVWDNV